MGQLIIRQLPNTMRPREKAMAQGMSALSDEELLALILRSGTKGLSAIDVARLVLVSCHGLAGLQVINLESLCAITGISQVKALELLAVVEIHRRMLRPDVHETIRIEEPQHVSAWLRAEIGFAQQEHFFVLYLNQQNELLRGELLFKGTLDRSLVHPREVFSLAVRLHCARLILAHNHPGGSLQPSTQDLDVTRLLVSAGKLMGIAVLDHLIVSQRGFCSLRAQYPSTFT